MALVSRQEFFGFGDIQVSDLAAVSHLTNLEPAADGQPGQQSKAAAISAAGEIVVSDFTALLFPYFDDYLRWNYDDVTPAIGITFITYSFIEDAALPDPLGVAYEPTSVFSFGSDQRDNARAALSAFSDVTGIVFVEVADGGMIDFLGITRASEGGFGYYPSITRFN